MSAKDEVTKELLKELIHQMHKKMADGDGDKAMSENPVAELVEEAKDKAGDEDEASEVEGSPEEEAEESPEEEKAEDGDDEASKLKDFFRGSHTAPKAPEGVTISVMGLKKAAEGKPSIKQVAAKLPDFKNKKSRA